MRSKPVATVFFVACLTLLFSCNRSSNQTSARKLLIYTPHGQAQLKDFIARYKQLHSDVDVQFLDMGSREILERIRALPDTTAPVARAGSGRT